MTERQKGYLHVGIMFALFVGTNFIPPFGQITELGIRVLSIFVATLYGWIFVDLLWSSLFGMIALAVIGYGSVSSIFAAGLGNATTLMTISALMFAYALKEVEFTSWLANFIITRKFIQGKPWRLVIGIVGAAYVLGLTCGMAGIFILWVIIEDLAENVGYKKGDSLIAFMIAMVVIALIGAGNTLPWKSGPIVFGGYFKAASGLQIDYIPFIVYTTVLTVLSLVCLCFFAKYIMKIDVSKFCFADEKLEQLRQASKMNMKQKIGFATTIIYSCCFLISGIFPQLPGMKFIQSFGVLGVSTTFILILWLIKDENGKPLINIAAACSHGVDWTLIWLLAVTFPLANAMMSADTGIIATIAQSSVSLFSSMSIIVFYIVAMLTATLITQVCHNIVLAAVMYPVLCPIVIALDGNPYTLFCITYMGLIAAYGSPAASVNGALVHGHEWAKGKNAYIIGWTVVVITIVLNIVIGIPLSSMLFKM